MMGLIEYIDSDCMYCRNDTPHARDPGFGVRNIISTRGVLCVLDLEKIQSHIKIQIVCVRSANDYVQ